MASEKSEKMRSLIEDLKAHTLSEHIVVSRKGIDKDVSLINHYRMHELIPNKWFDWVARSDARIMVIGQDWGPYAALKKYVDDFDLSQDADDFDYHSFLFKTFSSRTEKFIMKAVKETYRNAFGTFDDSVFDDFFFTMAVLFTRQGTHFRGNDNFDEKRSYEYSYPFVTRQIEIVKPEIIMPIGGLGFKVVNDYFKLGYDKRTLTSVIEELGDSVIRVNGTVIIPNFHPASHTSPAFQLQRWAKIWEYYKLRQK